MYSFKAPAVEMKNPLLRIFIKSATLYIGNWYTLCSTFPHTYKSSNYLVQRKNIEPMKIIFLFPKLL